MLWNRSCKFNILGLRLTSPPCGRAQVSRPPPDGTELQSRRAAGGSDEEGTAVSEKQAPSKRTGDAADASAAAAATTAGSAGSWSETAVRVLRERYLLRDASGAVVETPDELCWRVATAVAQAEAQ